MLIKTVGELDLRLFCGMYGVSLVNAKQVLNTWLVD